VRELRNLLERLSIQYGGDLIATADLPARYRETQGRCAPAVSGAADASQKAGPQGAAGAARLPLNGLDLKAYLAELESSLIRQALEDTDSVVARAADRLHIRRTTLVEKMRKYGIARA
jgi:sigma-54 specific flagellar transcriptional regulator A